MLSASQSAVRAKPFSCGPRRPLVVRRLSLRVMANNNFHSFTANTLEGKPMSFDAFKGKVVLVTNVACACGLTSSNYRELVQLHNKYGKDGLEIMAWPCNQFGRQEPGSPEQIKQFVVGNFGGDGLTMMEKIDVNGPGTHPVWQYLKGACAGCDGNVTWNFGAKFLVDKAGNVVTRSGDNPMACEPKIKELLAA